MTPTELRKELEEGVRALRSLPNAKVTFRGVYSKYYLITDNDNFICLCAEGYGYLVKVNPNLPIQKIVPLFYYQMTVKVVK